jgi:hypothetical protein
MQQLKIGSLNAIVFLNMRQAKYSKWELNVGHSFPLEIPSSLKLHNGLKKWAAMLKVIKRPNNLNRKIIIPTSLSAICRSFSSAKLLRKTFNLKF